jgi:hypothetical protein
MHNRKLWQSVASLVLLFAFLCQGTSALAQSTTGNLRGVVLDETGKAVAGASVSALSPSQTGKATTDGSGRFTILSLAPDTYTVTVTATGFSPLAQGGVTVISSQTQDLSLRANHALARIGGTTARARSELVHSGVTSQVYNVNASTQTAVQGLGGGNNIDNAYSAIVSTPGTYVAQGGAGWGQTIFIHGADYAQVGYQYDGIPINRAFDNYNSNTLTNLGQQELQVFTGGAPPGSSSQTVGGYINQVIKTGTYPAYSSLQLGMGALSFYNQGRFETGGATPSRSFSYYSGVSNYGQDFRYFTQKNGVGVNPTLQNYSPASGATNNVYYGYGVIPYCLPDGTDPGANATGGDPGCNTPFAPNVGQLHSTNDQEGVVNLHFGLPHHSGSGLRDDIQLLASVSHLTDRYYSSANDVGPNLLYGLAGGKPPGYRDAVVFPNGTQPLQSATGLAAVPYFFPSSPSGRMTGSNCGKAGTGVAAGCIPANLEDGIQVDTGITKLQFQHAFSDHAYARVYGYTTYSDWLQNGPFFATAAYGGYAGAYGSVASGAVSGDYELDTHTRGLSLDLVDQINSRNLLSFSANYTTATTMRYNNSTYNNTSSTAATNLVSVTNGVYTCYSYTTGAVAPCLSGSTRGTFGNPTRGGYVPPAGTAAAAAGAQWLVTKVGPAGTYNTVKPSFYSYALTDQANITDKLLLNFGLRLEQYQYQLVPLQGGIYPFWYQAAANGLCYNPTNGQPVQGSLGKGAAPPAAPLVSVNCPMINGVQTLHPNGQNGAELFTNAFEGNINRVAFEPRFSGTYTVNPSNVLRFSFGKYSQPVQTAYTEYNNLDPSSLTSAGGAGANFALFSPLGFLTPKHDLPPAVSYNSDFSFEHQFKGSDWSASFSPFYRRTLNQYQTVSIGPNFASAYPAANQNSFGYELAIRKGDPSREGWSGQLSYTYTKTGIRFNDTPAGNNPIDNINSFINSYNALTSTGTLVDPHNPNAPHVAGSPCYVSASDPRGATDPNFKPGTPYSGCSVSGGKITMDPSGVGNGAVVNPYYFAGAQPLLDRKATYPAFDTFPYSPTGSNLSGQTLAPPAVITGFASYKHRKLTVTPNFQLAQPPSYGSPLAAVGYDPRNCNGNQGGGGWITPPDPTTGTPGVPYPVVPTAPNPGAANYLACQVQPSAFVNGGVLAIPNPETGTFDGFGAFKQPWVFGMNLQLGYDVSPKVHANILFTNLFNRCFGGSKMPWSTGVTAPSSTTCGYGGGTQVFNWYNGSGPNDVAANGPLPANSAHTYAPFAQPFQPLNVYFQLQFKL